MKRFLFRFEFHWSLFLGVQLTTSKHWFAEQVTSHYLTNADIFYRRIYAALGRDAGLVYTDPNVTITVRADSLARADASP